MTHIVLVAHNLRSTHNVGSLLRTADGLGVKHIYLTGYTPYPTHPGDTRLPHLAEKLTKQIAKTALGAEKRTFWDYEEDAATCIATLKERGYVIVAVEQTSNAISLPDYKPPQKIALLVGRETKGIEPEILKLCDVAVEIPMFGEKESFNVVQAAAMALYHCTFTE